jgi:hypothetical protein
MSSFNIPFKVFLSTSFFTRERKRKRDRDIKRQKGRVAERVTAVYRQCVRLRALNTNKRFY